MPRLAIVWDFDGTLSPSDSTTIVANHFGAKKHFWKTIKKLGRLGRSKLNWEHILASDAPIWMYSLARMADAAETPLNRQFFKKFIVPQIDLYPGVITFLQTLKNLEKKPAYKAVNLEVKHFIVTAGLKNLVEQVFPRNLIEHTFGCRYETVLEDPASGEIRNVPVFCMDETMKTRSLFEISKGSFINPRQTVNSRIPEHKLWAPFSNLIYIGDGDTDVPALSLTKSRGGKAIVVYNPKKNAADINKRLKNMRRNNRADAILPADFTVGGELYNYIANLCDVARLKYNAERALPT